MATSLDKGGLTRSQMRKVTEYLETHVSSRISMRELSALVGLSQWHFSRVFSRATGLSPAEYLMQLRLQRAATLLEVSDWTVCEISLSCGFFDQSHLTRRFRKTLGVTPMQWRRRFLQVSQSASYRVTPGRSDAALLRLSIIALELDAPVGFDT